MCTGYQRERIFILSQGPVVDSPDPEVSTQKLRSELHGTSSADGKKHDSLLPPRSSRSTHEDSKLRPGLQFCLPKDIPLHAALRQQLLSEFLYCYLPDSMLAGLQRGPKEETSWLVQVAESTALTKALETAIMALCTAKLGRLHDDPVMVKASLRCYTKGLKEAQRALWDPNLMYHDETLAACMTLSMYEMLECPAQTHNGWTGHFDGCARLVQLRGAEAHSSAMAHQIFVPFRITAVSLFCSCPIYSPDYMAMQQPASGPKKSAYTL